MPFTKIIISYLLTTIVFFAIDIVWLGVVAKDLYAKHLSHFMADNVNWTAAIIFYLLYIAGILVFAVYPAVEKNSFSYALIYGAFFGLVAYATYDLTNLATLKDWPFKIVVVDIIWGTLLCTLVASASYMIGRWLN